MRRAIILVTSLLSISYSIQGFTVTVDDCEILGRISNHLGRYDGGAFIDRFPTVDNAVSSAMNEILKNTISRKVRILEVGPGDEKSSICFRALKKYFQSNESFPENILLEIWFVEPNLKNRELIITHWESFSKDWFQKFRTKIRGKISKSLGQDFFTGDIFNKLKGEELEPFELIVSSNVLHFMKPEDQMSFLKGASGAMKSGSQLILLTKGIHENLNQLDPFTKIHLLKVKQDFDLNLKDGNNCFPGFIPWLFEAYIKQGRLPIMYHSGITLRDVLSLETLSLTVEKSEDLLTLAEIIVDERSTMKEIPSVFAIARKK